MSKLGNLLPRVHAILIVDDDPDILDSLRELFQSTLRDVTIHTAEDPLTGLKILDGEDVDLILSDYRMPRMDGIEFLQKALEKIPQVPRILITAYPDTDLARRAVEMAQVENFIVKPFNPTRLVEAVNAALLKRRSQSRREKNLERQRPKGQQPLTHPPW